MESYIFGLVVLTMLTTLNSGRAVSRNETLPVGSVFKFQCDVNVKDPLKLFETPLLYSYYNPVTQKSFNLSQNSHALVDGWSTLILDGSNSSFFPFELSRIVTLNESGVYTCSRGTVNNSVVLTVEELVHGLSAGENLAPMGLMTILFLSVLGLLGLFETEKNNNLTNQSEAREQSSK